MKDSEHGLRHGPLSPSCVHICIDMQRLFAEDTAWKTPWMRRVLPRIVSIVETHPQKTVFTRFIPAERPGQGNGVWSRYWTRWAQMTLENLPREFVELAPELAPFAETASVIDKNVYSPWIDRTFEEELARRGADTLIITGSETDVCVLATVMGAIDRGYRVIIVVDAVCSSSDETHDALMTLYAQRYSQHVETVDTATLLDAWRA